MSQDAVVDLYERHARAYDRVSLARDFAGARPATIRGGVAPQQTEHAQGAVTAPPAGWLQLLTPKSHHFLKSSFGDMPRHRRGMGRPTLEMHPDDATARGLADGTRVAVRNGQGEVHAWLRATDAVPPEIATRPAPLPGTHAW